MSMSGVVGIKTERSRIKKTIQLFPSVLDEESVFSPSSLESIESNTDCSQSQTQPQHHPEEWVGLDQGPTDLQPAAGPGPRAPHARLLSSGVQHFLQILKDLDHGERERETP